MEGLGAGEDPCKLLLGTLRGLALSVEALESLQAFTVIERFSQAAQSVMQQHSQSCQKGAARMSDQDAALVKVSASAHCLQHNILHVFYTTDVCLILSSGFCVKL